MTKNISFKKRLPAIPSFIRTRWKLFILLVIILAVGGIWFIQSRQPEVTTLNFQQPQRQTLIKTLDVSGVVDAKEKAQLRFLTGGDIIYIGAQVGDWVQRYQTIARTDARTAAKQKEKTLNNYMIERWDWENTQDAIEDRTLSDEERRDVEQEQFTLNNTVLDVEIQQIAISDSYLTAPFAGILTASPTSVAGVQLAPTDYFEIVNPDTLLFRAAVDEADIADVSLGQSAVIELDAYPEKLLDSQISYVAYTSSTSSTGTVFLVEMPLSNPDISTFRLGMNGDVKIELARQNNALSIPLIATRERDGKVFVDVKTAENQYEEREITVGMETEDRVEVISGLNENDWVLIPE